MSKELIIMAIGLAFVIFPCGLAYHFCHLEIFCDDKPIGSHQFTHDFLAWWWKIPAELKGKKVLLVPTYDECPVHPVSLEVQL